MKTVLITGATSGIGFQLALDYLNQGWHVVACGRNEKLLSSLQSAYPNAETLQFDITKAAETRQAMSQMQSKPSVWIFNAGNCEYIENGHLDSELLRRVFDTNFMGLVNSIESTQDRFERGDSVVVVGSISSEVALPRAEAYGASKAAVSYLARTLQVTLKPKGIHVSVVYPGFVETPLTDKNTFDMPMIVSAEHASTAIRKGIEKRTPHIYFPSRFTSILRLIGLLPYRWQNALTAKLLKG
ncbi:SDR family NAD(P)-dependent oxidoreductase [Vibrio taketomensis]|uniref:SDR family NAD(P)-dependent oxidoreductase n=1 Tax=Vibrio taketomensis TaxID=2572923 RepID=UPI001389615E|nr:SDR family NAD(P)-dependent oxidoreductase [Vibrio taketomensis]